MDEEKNKKRIQRYGSDDLEDDFTIKKGKPDKDEDHDENEGNEEDDE